MAFHRERRQVWHRIVGVERRGAPLDTLMGRALPDPTHLIDEDFQAPGPKPDGRKADQDAPQGPHRTMVR